MIKAKQTLQDENSEWITLLACVCAGVFALSPGLIYPAGTNNIQSDSVEDINQQKHSVLSVYHLLAGQMMVRD